MNKNEHTLNAFDYKNMWNGFKTKYGDEYMFFEGGNSVEEMMREYKKDYIDKGKKHFCLYCGTELDFVPTKDGGFCSIECEDSYFETNGIEK